MSWSSQHAETLLGVLLGLLFSIPVGFYLSLYSGLIVARRARFEDLRYELIRILQCLEWPPGAKGFRLVGGHRTYDITLISSDLIALGHPRAADIVAGIDSEVSGELIRNREFPTPDQMEKQFSEWMRKVRTMHPNSWPILDPRPRLYRKIRYRSVEN
jgi:hypothetical protein